MTGAAAVIALLDTVAEGGAELIHDYIEEAREGQIQPLYERADLQQEAINILAIFLTARVLGFELGVARVIGAIVFGVIIGVFSN